MENNTLDNDYQTNDNYHEYAGFWTRALASIIDTLIMIPIFGLTFYNNVTIKSLPLTILLSLIYVSYKIGMEGKSGATIGKKAMHIKIVNTDLSKINFETAIKRNALYIISALVTAYSSYLIFTADGFENITSFIDFSTFSNDNGAIYETYGVNIVIIVAVLVAAFSKHKQTLYDLQAKTYCIKS